MQEGTRGLNPTRAKLDFSLQGLHFICFALFVEVFCGFSSFLPTVSYMKVLGTVLPLPLTKAVVIEVKLVPGHCTVHCPLS